MKNLKEHIVEGLKIGAKTKVNTYSYHPKDRDELKELVQKLIKERGKNADLNDIDTSAITDMSNLFDYINFDGDISNWDVRNVEDMNGMFLGSKFTGKNSNLSNWDVSKVTDMSWMFSYSKFDDDISNWNVSNVNDMSYMFYQSKFNGDLSKWDVSNVENMKLMFYQSKFTGENGDISNWNVDNVKNVKYILKGCSLEKNPPKWYKNKK